MFKRKCLSCAKKVERRFNFCPYCGESFKVRAEKSDFGMLGRDDSGSGTRVEPKLPFGMEKIMNSLVKQLEKQMGSMNGEGMPKGIRINVMRGNPQMGQVVQRAPEKKIIDVPRVSEEENERRMMLSKVEAESRVKRLSDTIIYEIETPGVKRKDDVVLTELATGLEIKAYSRDKCYVKFIPLKVEVVEYYVEKERVVVEIKG